MAPILIALFHSLLFQGYFYQPNVTSGGGGYVGPGDVVSSAIAWWGLRCYNTAYTGSVADVFDSATGTTTETLLTCSSGGTINQTIHTLAVTCASGCRVKTLYDQSGNTNCTGGNPCNFGNNTNASRPILTQSCIGALPCMTFAAAQQLINPLTGSITAQAQPFTWSTAARQTSSLAGAIIGDSNSEIYFTATPQIRLYAGTNQSVASVNNTWYAIQGFFNGASSVAYINGTSNALASPGASATGNTPTMGTDQFGQLLTGNILEVGLWGIGFSAGQQSSMNSNQRTYWGF